MDPAWPESRTYVILSSLNWIAFLGAVLLLTWGTGAGWFPLAAVLAVVTLAALSVVGQFVAAYRLIAAQDEFVRGLTAKRALAAAGVTLAAAVFWGLAEQFLAAPNVPMWCLYPLFWGAFGLVTPFVQTSRA